MATRSFSKRGDCFEERRTQLHTRLVGWWLDECVTEGHRSQAMGADDAETFRLDNLSEPRAKCGDVAQAVEVIQAVKNAVWVASSAALRSSGWRRRRRTPRPGIDERAG